MTREGRAIIQAEHRKHRDALHNIMMSKNLTFEESLNQVILMENISNCIETVANYMDKEIQFMQLFDLCGFDRELIRELHVTKYVFTLGD